MCGDRGRAGPVLRFPYLDGPVGNGCRQMSIVGAERQVAHADGFHDERFRQFTGRRLEESYRGVTVSRGDPTAIVAVGNTKGHPVARRQLGHKFAGRRIPDAFASPPIAAKVRPSGTVRDFPSGCCHPRAKLGPERPSLDIPAENRLIVVSRNDSAAVRAERQPRHRAMMSPQRAHRPAVGRVPEPDKVDRRRPMRASGHPHCRPRRERHRCGP